MRVLLTMPDYGLPSNKTKFMHRELIMPPLGLEYLAAYIEDLAEVRIIDNRVKKMNIQVVEKTIKKFRPDYVGISCILSSQACITCNIAEIAKRQGSQVVVGGWHPTFVPDEMLELPSIDVIVRGEGEETFRELIKKGSPVGVLGLSYKQNGKQVHNPDRDLLDLKQIRLPARHYRSSTEEAAYNFFGFPVECIEITRGCPYSCTFCSIHGFYKHKYRYRAIPDVIKELHSSKIKNRASLVYIVDDNFVVDRKYIMALCDAIIQNGIKMFFKTQVRVDTVVNHPDVYKKMADAGFLFLFLGLESFSDRTLKKLKKRFKFEETKAAIKILHDLGYIVQANVILGANLEDTKKDLETTIEIAKTLDIDMPSFTLLTSFPGTELMDQILKENRLLTKSWYDFNWRDPNIKFPHLTSDELIYYLDKAYSEINFLPNLTKRIGKLIRTRGWKFFISRLLQVNQIKMIPKLIKNFPSLQAMKKGGFHVQ